MAITKRADVALIVLLPAIVTFTMLRGGGAVVLALFALVLLVPAVYIGLRHPFYYFLALAVALGAIPYSYLPGIHVPIPFALAFAIVVATLIHRNSVKHVTKLEAAVVLLMLASILSVIVTGRGILDYVELGKWLVCTGIAVALLRLPRADLTKFGKTYVYAAFVAALFAIFTRFVDKNGSLIKILSPIGYGKEENSNRYVYSSDGSASVRLAATYIDPNAAGISLFVALVLCVSLMQGRTRLAIAAVLFAATVLTLSRAALFTVVGAVVLVFLFQKLRLRERLSIVGAFLAALAIAFAIPSVRARVFSSFGGSDTGSSARGDALAEYPGKLAGHWFFGLGWGRKEFKDPATAFISNFVANSPLLAIYRGGIFVGIAFVMVLVIGSYLGYLCLRSTRWDYGFMGAGFFSFCVVALQLDYPVVTLPALTMTFSVLIVFMVFTWEKATGNLPTVSKPASAKTVDHSLDSITIS